MNDLLSNLIGFHIPPAAMGNYPPYNIINVNDTEFVVEIACAGFTKQDINITVKNDHLLVSGEATREPLEGKYAYQGISNRKFRRLFTLSPHMVVKGAAMENGILTIRLAKEIPEEEKPKTITID